MNTTASSLSYIDLKDVSLVYDLHTDRGGSLKETVVNFFKKPNYTPIKKTQFHALNHVNVRIEHGERVGIIGHNGSGKSTMLKVMSRLLVPNKGNITIEGKVQPLIEIGAGFNPEYSGRENIYFNGSMLGFSKEAIQKREQEIIDFTELGDFIDVPIKYYSSGMSVKLAFTIATMIEPEILLLDEMLSAGDLEFIEKAKNRMEKLLTTARILVLVSHDLSLVRSLTTRTLVMDHGKLVFDGPTEDAIAYYHDKTAEKMQAKQASAPASPELEPPPAAANLFTIHGRALLDASDAHTTEVDQSAPLRVMIRFEAHQTVSRFLSTLTLLNRVGDFVATISSEHMGEDWEKISTGVYEMKLEIPEHHLPPGEYRWAIRLMNLSPDGTQVVEDTGFHPFRITGSQNHMTAQKALWSLRKDENKSG